MQKKRSDEIKAAETIPTKAKTFSEVGFILRYSRIFLTIVVLHEGKARSGRKSQKRNGTTDE